MLEPQWHFGMRVVELWGGLFQLWTWSRRWVGGRGPATFMMRSKLVILSLDVAGFREIRLNDDGRRRGVRAFCGGRVFFVRLGAAYLSVMVGSPKILADR